MRRFFVNPTAISGDTAVLTGPEAHHLQNVLRLGPGEPVILFDGTGNSYEACVKTLCQDEARLTILAVRQTAKDRALLHLGQGLLKGKKMDLVIQKATELGVASILPFVSRHCAVKAPAADKIARWQRIAIEACKQCNRPTPPACPPPDDFHALVQTPASFDSKLFFWEQETGRSLEEIFTPGLEPKSLLFLVGPEGGFSRKEHQQAVAAGFTPVSLGRRTLRAETASLAATAILQYLLGNLTPLP